MHTASIDLLLEYDVTRPAHFLFNVEAAFDSCHRVVSERLSIAPSVKVRTFTDERCGNRFVRLDAPKGLLTLSYHADVELMPTPVPLYLDEALVTSVPDDALRYLFPSRYCESDLLSRAAQQLFGNLPHGLSRVRAIEAWIFESVQYLPGSSNSTTTAQDVFIQRMGVCRDFAHLGVTFCRALNIPARLVVGYVNFEDPPQDFHALFEAWLDDRWVLFDATRLAPTDRLVRVGTGRDAKDVAFATIFGGVQMVRKELRVLEGDKPDAAPMEAVQSFLAAA
jgi:transglutaminase-like putative cysteine protease